MIKTQWGGSHKHEHTYEIKQSYVLVEHFPIISENRIKIPVKKFQKKGYKQ